MTTPREQVKAGVPVGPRLPKLVANRELQTMAAIDSLLSDLDDNARTRVIAWVVSSYAPGHLRVSIQTDPEKVPPGVSDPRD